MRKVADVLAVSTIVVLLWFCSELLGQAVERDSAKPPPRPDNSDWQSGQRGPTQEERIASRYLELAKRYVDLHMREGRSKRIEEVTKAFEEEVEQLEAAEKKKQTEMKAERKLAEARTLLEQILEAYPNTEAAKIAQRSMELIPARALIWAPPQS